MSDEFQFKALVLGDSAIGKTCLLDRLLDLNTVDWEDPQFVPTSQCSFEKSFSYDNNGAQEEYLGEFWDTAGWEAMRALRMVAFKDADVTLIAYDMTRPSSLQNVLGQGGDASWHKEVLEHGNKKTGIVLVGTKYDLWLPRHEAGDSSVTTYHEAQRVAHQIGAVALICTSAKTGYGVVDQPDKLQAAPSSLLHKVLQIASVSADFGQSLPRLSLPPVPAPPEESNEQKVDEFVISPDKQPAKQKPEQGPPTEDPAQDEQYEVPAKDADGREGGCGCKCAVM